MNSTRAIAYSVLIAAALSGASAQAATNLINNGSFETGSFSGWTFLNNSGLANPSVVIAYGQNSQYPTGAYGETVPVDDATPVAPLAGSPDAAGSYAAYFVDDNAVNDSLQQLTYLKPGNYEIGFDAYLTANGAANANDATFSGSIIGTQVTAFSASGKAAQTWVNYSAVAEITKAGYYDTNFTFNSFGNPAKDVIIDRVYAVASTLPATVIIPPFPTAVPEPAAWALMLVGFGGLGASLRRRRAVRSVGVSI